jgi:hypothetical protein
MRLKKKINLNLTREPQDEPELPAHSEGLWVVKKG